MIKRFLYIFASLALVGCSEKDSLWSEMPEDAVEMKGVSPLLTRSAGIEVAELADYVGRKEFSDQDIAVFTRVRRTLNPINQFNYKDLEFKCAVGTTNNITSIGWSRIAGRGTTEADTDMSPDRIYWTDATNPHTFIGYCKPQQGTGEKAFDWAKYTYDGLETYYGSLGDPTITGDIDYTSDIDSETKDTLQGNEKICKDDILLTYSEEIKAEDAIARLRFHHGLAQVRVIVNISDFAAGGDENSADKKSIVSDMVLKNMLTMYKWNQTDSTTVQLAETDGTALSTIYGATHPAYNQRKDVKLWIRHPKGLGTGSNKIFTFYGLAVPTQIVEGTPLQLRFKVTYPNPMNPTQMQEKTYATSIHGIRFTSGKCTTINISLNHKNEKMTVGAEYDDWDFIESLDQGALKKNSTFLSSTNRTQDANGNYNVTILGDKNATADDATWLYVNKEDKVVDVYGNDGSAANPFTISTAKQLLSFAYEVAGSGRTNTTPNDGHTSGWDFENKYIKLDADIHLQSVVSVDSLTKNKEYNTGLLEWIGIGTSEKKFNGTFLGSSRYITHLKGKAVFMNLGAKAIVSDLNLSNVVSVSSHGAIAEENAGEIVACRVEGDVMSEADFVGSICGVNNGKIFACIHNGKTEGGNNSIVGGLLGRNGATGQIAASYHTGSLEGKTTCGVVGQADTGNTILGCYYNSTLAHPNSTVDSEHVKGITIGTMQSKGFVTEINNIIIGIPDLTDKVKLYRYVFTPGAYPRVELTTATN